MAGIGGENRRLTITLLQCERVVTVVDPKIAIETLVVYRAREDTTQDYHIEGLPFGTRGGLLFEHLFPSDGEYTITGPQFTGMRCFMGRTAVLDTGTALAAALAAVGVAMAGPTIIAHGTEEQKARYPGPMLHGDEVWCQLFSEPAAGSDLAGIQARAKRLEDGSAVRVCRRCGEQIILNKTVLFVGRKERYKGYHALRDAAKIVSG